MKERGTGVCSSTAGATIYLIVTTTHIWKPTSYTLRSSVNYFQVGKDFELDDNAMVKWIVIQYFNII